jgi:hypothetical protein
MDPGLRRDDVIWSKTGSEHELDYSLESRDPWFRCLEVSA